MLDFAENLGYRTKSVHAGEMDLVDYGPVRTPLYLTSNYKVPTDGRKIDWDATEQAIYTRNGNDNLAALEKKLAVLEGAEACCVFASGVAALAAVFMSVLHAGDHIVCSTVVYAAVRRMFTEILPPQFEIEVSFVDTSDTEAVRTAIKDNTKLIHVETPGNPSTLISDVAAISNIAKEKGIFLSVDNTFASPYCQCPLSLGADFSVSSLTKYCNGHGDALGGCVMSSALLMKRIKSQMRVLFGGILSPFNAWLIARGLITLPLRMEQHNKNAMAVAKFLETRDEVSFVYYPGLESHPNHVLASKQMHNGYSGMLMFGLKYDDKKCMEFISKLKLIIHAVSLGDSESLIIYGETTSDVMPYYPEIMHDGYFRFSTGLEDSEDIVADLEQALEAIKM